MQEKRAKKKTLQHSYKFQLSEMRRLSEKVIGHLAKMNVSLLQRDIAMKPVEVNAFNAADKYLREIIDLSQRTDFKGVL